MRFSTPVLDTPDKTVKTHKTRARRASGFAPPPRADYQPVDRRLVTRLLRDRGAAAALVLLAVLTMSSLVAPLLSPYGGEGDFAQQLQVPTLQHPFGTDDLGRDLFLRVMHGGRISLAAGACAVLVALLIGASAGAVAGYHGGVIDALVMRTVDLMLSLPTFFIILFLARVIMPGFLLICLLIAMTQWMEVARVVRSVVLKVKENEYVEAARALGIPDRRILFHHILVQASAPMLVTATIGVAQAIMLESAISFLGFGVQPPLASWGALLTGAQSYLGTAPWLAIFPGLMILFTVMSCYALSDFLTTTLKSRPR